MVEKLGLEPTRGTVVMLSAGKNGDVEGDVGVRAVDTGAAELHVGDDLVIPDGQRFVPQGRKRHVETQPDGVCAQPFDYDLERPAAAADVRDALDRAVRGEVDDELWPRDACKGACHVEGRAFVSRLVDRIGLVSSRASREGRDRGQQQRRQFQVQRSSPRYESHGKDR